MTAMTNRAAGRPAIPPADDTRRLLAGWADTGRPAGIAEHLHRYGPAPVEHYAGRVGRQRLVAMVESSGLLGRGGAGFPTGRKLRTVAGGGRRPVVVANGCEGEPVSDKDHALLTLAPHLVLDGAQLAAHAVAAAEIVVCVHRDDPLVDAVTAALAERPAGETAIRVVRVPDRYVASEESALVNFVNTGDARPTAKPPRPFERGVRGRPTLVDNVETLAQLALIARYGPGWFRGCGTPDSPGTALVTVGGAIAAPGVYETALGESMGSVLDRAGGPREPVQAVLVGGYGGSWLPLPFAAHQRLTHADLRAAGASLGVGALVLLPVHACGIAETARVLRYLAGESALQCGPCMFGLPSVAGDFAELVLGGQRAGDAVDRLRRRLTIVSGRGACGHPDGAIRLARSALRVFDRDLAAHLAGRPCAGASRARLPIPRRTSGNWR
jgi:NADH:ubiquinone oxidoreductase subunit F (NADH-binding)